MKEILIPVAAPAVSAEASDMPLVDGRPWLEAVLETLPRGDDIRHTVLLPQACQRGHFLADMIGAPVDRPRVTETTALGAAYLAGLAAGLCPDPEQFGQQWTLERRFQPRMPAEERESRHARWQRAVAATL